MATLHDELIRDYGKRIMQSTYTFSPEEYARSAKRFAKLYDRILPRNKSASIVDVGCGDGHFLYYLKQAGYANIQGLDASDDRLDLCRQHVTEKVECADAVKWMPEHAGQFDVISCHHVIEHIPESSVLPFVQALRAGLKPGGLLLLVTPNACTPWAGYNLYHDMTHLRLYTADSLTQLLTMAGFAAEILPEGSVAFDAPSALRWAAWKAREWCLKMQFRIDVGGHRGNHKTPLIVSPNLIALGR